MWAVEFFNPSLYTTVLFTSGSTPILFSKKQDAEKEAREHHAGRVFHWYKERHGWDSPRLGYSLDKVSTR